MFIRDLNDCRKFIAGDGTILREVLHPAKDDLDLRYSLAHALLPAGRASLRHRLSVSEVYQILDGIGIMTIDGERRAVAAGHTIYIPPGAVQSIENPGPGDLRFLCIVDPAWTPDREEVLEGPPGEEG